MNNVRSPKRYLIVYSRTINQSSKKYTDFMKSSYKCNHDNALSLFVLWGGIYTQCQWKSLEVCVDLPSSDPLLEKQYIKNLPFFPWLVSLSDKRTEFNFNIWIMGDQSGVSPWASRCVCVWGEMCVCGMEEAFPGEPGGAYWVWIPGLMKIKYKS